jgi:epoxyqueuosine reductase
MSLAENIKKKAIELGFDLVGITDTSPIDDEQIGRLTSWLKSGFAGQMSYLRRNLQKRINPATLLEGAQSVIIVGLNFKPPKCRSSLRASQSDARQSHPDKFKIASSTFGGLAMTVPTAPAGKVASYAQYEDYHAFIKKQLRKLTEFIKTIAGIGNKFKICVDSSPLAERALATRAGLGFIGKNHLLINPILGPQVFLGEIITTLKLKPDKPNKNKCLACNKCISACPTGALKTDGQFNATKCINYLTIEYKGQIPSDLAEKIGDHLFGCEECILACPYQQNAPVCKNKQFKFYDDRAELDLEKILESGDEQFEMRFTDSVIRRLGLTGLQRNARICLANV